MFKHVTQPRKLCNDAMQFQSEQESQIFIQPHQILRNFAKDIPSKANMNSNSYNNNSICTTTTKHNLPRILYLSYAGATGRTSIYLTAYIIRCAYRRMRTNIVRLHFNIYLLLFYYPLKMIMYYRFEKFAQFPCTDICQ